MTSAAGFPPTRWTLVLQAGQQGDKVADRALDELCRAYWYPVYAFVRRSGKTLEEAQDLTQDFFVRFLERRYVAHADPAKGRFRSFLLVSVKHFLLDQEGRRFAEKRGGRDRIMALDCIDLERRFGAELSTHETPEAIFDRSWAQSLVARVMDDVRDAMDREGQSPLFDQLKPFLPGNDETISYSELASKLGTTEGALKVAVHRLRRKYREIFRAEIAHLVSDPGEVDDEVRYLLRALRA